MDLTDTLHWHLLKQHILLNDSDERFFEQFGLGKARFYALFHLRQKGGLSLSELSKLLLCTKGNTTRLIKSLEADGYVRRESDARDQRALRLTLTEEGEKLLAEVSEARRRFNEERLGWLGPERIQSLIETLSVLNDHLETRLRQN